MDIANSSAVTVTVTASSTGSFIDDFSAHTKYPGPTAIVVSQFAACADGGAVKLRWMTASECNTVGFDVYRLEGATWVRLNDTIIPACSLFNGGMGGTYEWIDPGAVPGGTYQYKLVEYETGGGTREYGPYERQATALQLVSPIQPTPEGIQLRWLSRTDETYRVLAAPGPGAEFRVVADGLSATPPENTWTDRDTSAGVRIYKVEME